MAEIQPISNGESGSSTRSKINDSFIQANVLINGVDTRTGSTLLFDNLLGSIYNAAAPSSANITLDATGALVGAVVAFYNDGSVQPTITGATPNPAAGTWQSGKVNVYWFMWDGTNFTQNIQAQLVSLPTLDDPTYTLNSGAALELDYSFTTTDANATGGVFQIDTQSDFLSGNAENVAGYSFGVDGTITTFGGLPLTATTYYTRLKSTASGYTDSGFAEENATATSVPALSTPTILVTSGNTENSINRTVEDVNATGGVLEVSADGVSGWSAVTDDAFVFGTNPTLQNNLTNGTEYFYRYKSTAAGYTDSAYATASGTPEASGVPIAFTFGADISNAVAEVYEKISDTGEGWGHSNTGYSGDFIFEVLMENNSGASFDAKTNIGISSTQKTTERGAVPFYLAGLNVQGNAAQSVRSIENSATPLATGFSFTWGTNNKLILKRVSNNVKGYMKIGGIETEVYDFGTILGTVYLNFSIAPTPNVGIDTFYARNLRVTT